MELVMTESSMWEYQNTSMQAVQTILQQLPNGTLLATIIVVITLLAFQLRFLSRPPPVPLKQLPKRPILSIQFRPDDPVTEKLMLLKKKQKPQSGTKVTDEMASPTAPMSSREDGSGRWSTSIEMDTSPYEEDLRGGEDENYLGSSNEPNLENAFTEEELMDDDAASTTFEVPLVRDLPDSFAPLLSSSHMEVETQHVPADLIHAVDLDASVRLRNGLHEIPLNKNKTRPQFRLVVPDAGCRIAASARVRSNSSIKGEEDSLRQAMLQEAAVVLDPPLPLANVAPTLIHFPTLFEDQYWRSLRIVKFLVHSAASFLWFLEKCLWIIESHCQIHLSKVKITPVSRKSEWRLQLSFSGHVLLWKVIPIPFIGIELPTFIIPQPHALLEKLLSSQPLASARLRRENIAEESIVVAVINAAESWDMDLKVTATPPAVGVDIMFAGGLSCALELGLWRDPQAGRRSGGSDDDDSMSSWTTRDGKRSSMHNTINPLDANDLEPWSLEFSAKGNVSREKLSVHVLKLSTQSGEKKKSKPLSYLATRGSFAVWRSDPVRSSGTASSSSPMPRLRKRPTHADHPELQAEDAPSVAAILLFPDETSSFHNTLRLLQYDFVFDVLEESRIDAVTLSIGATHPMLKGGTMITTILDSIFAYGTVMAREDSVIDPVERSRKRNILRHLPATNFTFGIQNVFIPPESDSYSDDGQSLLQPEMDGGRMIVRFLGGMDESEEDAGSHGSHTSVETITDGIKLVADFEIPSLVTDSETCVKEFPELEIFDGVKLISHMSGVIGGSINAHLRPQRLDEVGTISTMGPNVLNPLEAYEIDFSKSSLLIKMREFSMALGHRRVMFPAETTFHIKIEESVVDMGFEGKTRCDLSWDFQGLSPMLQVTTIGETPEDALPENKVQVSLLVSPLRQGRFSLWVSSVGGISITKAATSRDDKEGLYDWKFFNALVSPDDGSMSRIWDVLHDKRTIEKLLQIVNVINNDLFKMLQYIMRQVWRGKEILDQEGVSDPKHAIPMYKMARLLSLFLTGDVDQVDEVLPIMKRVIDGDGLDTVKLKDLLREHLDFYDTWAPEIDRLVRWAAVGFDPVAASPPYVEDQVYPLAELPQFAASLEAIPCAKKLYDTLLDKPQLPLDASFSNLVSRVAPYLSFKQVEWILQTRATTDWQPSDLRRIRYVFSIKRKVEEIAESYGGLSFLPQSFFLSVFIGEATRTSLRASAIGGHKRSLPRKGGRSKLSSRTLGRSRKGKSSATTASSISSLRTPPSTLNRLRRRRFVPVEHSLGQVPEALELRPPSGMKSNQRMQEPYQLGDSLLGPQDVAILLQAGLTSVMKSSTVVQLNQRMLLDLIESQPRSFAIAVLAEIGTSSRSLTSALMALLELDQTAFKVEHQTDVHAMIESWFPEIKVPRREDHMAGGRWARQSYYEAVFSVATRIGEDARQYRALKSHVQRVRHSTELDDLPQPRCKKVPSPESVLELSDSSSKLDIAVQQAISMITKADEAGQAIMEPVIQCTYQTKQEEEYTNVIALYEGAFDACAKVLALDKHTVLSPWFREFYRRNYDAFMIKSLVDNVQEDVDRVRHWLGALFAGSTKAPTEQEQPSSTDQEWHDLPPRIARLPEDIFEHPEKNTEQDILDAILQSVIYEEEDRERLRNDPLVRLLIPNPPGKYNFVVVSAAGVVTEGKEGTELKDAFERLKSVRGVDVIRADTATARSLDYNAAKVEEAIEVAEKLRKPFGLLGYSQGCANALLAESLLNSGTPRQRDLLCKAKGGLVCRQLLFSAANGSLHGPTVEKKVQRLISMGEDFFKSQAGYCSSAFSSAILETLNSLLDSAPFHKAMGSAQSFLPDGCREFWREVQHLSHVPTCTLRGVMETHTTPESLEMMSNMLSKQSSSPLHDSQVHVFDAVGYPIYHINRNGRLLRQLCIGNSAVQRTHHWSPLDYEVDFVRTSRDTTWGAFDCAKDRHVFPWVEVNRRFGLIEVLPDDELADVEDNAET